MGDDNLVNWIQNLIENDNIKAFYNSGSWQNIRAEILEEQRHECQMCKERGMYSEAVTVHHVEHVKKRPDLALTKSNLMSLCKECHNEVHPEKNKYHAVKPQLNIERW